MRRRRTGYVARLAHEVREEINRMLLDGMSYPKIAEAMGKKGIVLKERSVSSWSRGGHQDWLKEQEQVFQMDRMRESALRMVQRNEGAKVSEAGLQLAAAQIFEVLLEFDPKVLKRKLNGDAEVYARLVHVMARLSEGGLKYEKYRAEVAERKERLLRELAEVKKEGLTRARLTRIEGDLNLL